MAHDPLRIRGLYGMADATFGDPVVQALMLAEEGIRPVQLRCKGWSVEAVRAAALALSEVPALVINDHAALALELGRVAHLGDGDGAATGPHGRSTHTLEQVRTAGDALYLGFGPVFSTGTKETGWPPRGVELLAEAVRVAGRPVVAIGGIEPSNLDAVRATGVAGWAVVGAIWRSSDPRAVIRSLRG